MPVQTIGMIRVRDRRLFERTLGTASRLEQRFGAMLDYAPGILDRVDRMQRLTHLDLAAPLLVEHRR